MNNAIIKNLILVAIELVEVKAELKALDRAFPYLDSGYYWLITSKLKERQAELTAILAIAEAIK